MNPNSSVFSSFLIGLPQPWPLPPPNPPLPSYPTTLGAAQLSSARESAQCFCKQSLLGAHHVLSYLCVMLPNTGEKPPHLQGGFTLILSEFTTSTYLCNKVQKIHPRFVCFCVCQFEQRRQFKSYCIASIPSLKKTNQKKKYIHIPLDGQINVETQYFNFFEFYLLHSWYSLPAAPSVILNVAPHTTSALPKKNTPRYLQLKCTHQPPHPSSRGPEASSDPKPRIKTGKHKPSGAFCGVSNEPFATGNPCPGV